MTPMAIAMIRGMSVLLTASVGPRVRLQKRDSCGEWGRGFSL